MKGMLFVSFGTSHEDTRAKTIDAIEARARQAFPDRAAYSAWTSRVIVRKVAAERGERHDTLDEALARITADGVDDLVVATTCLMQGAEMAKIRKAIGAWAAGAAAGAGGRAPGGVAVRVAEPLLASSDDCAAVARVLRDEFAYVGEREALLLMGHGSPRGGNEVYRRVQDALRAQGLERFFVATVEGEPTFEDVLPLVEASGATRVYLAPLMIVAGDHAKNDLAGEGAGSWASMLAARGFKPVPVLRGLGEYAGIQQLVCDHTEQAPALKGDGARG